MGCCCSGSGTVDNAKNKRNTDTEPLINRNEPIVVDDLHRIDIAELGQFILKKMNDQTIQKLWKHLDADGSGHIERNEVLNILQWVSFVFVAFKCRRDKIQGKPDIDKSLLKIQMVPVKNWILHKKMRSKNEVSRDEFRELFGAWLAEYAELKR